MAINITSHLEDKSSWIVGLKAQCLARLGYELEAVTLVQETIQLAPDDMESHYTAALTYTLIGDYKSAVVAAQRSVDLGMSPLWFSLPWFDPLREEERFVLTLNGEKG